MTDASEPPSEVTRPRYSIVVPTHQRREIVTAALRALAELEGPSYEVVVVVDGSTDGTAARLRELAVPFPLRVVEQANAGAAAARNAGAALAHGEMLLFLDDDMHAAPDLLLAHDRAYERGADAVMGHIPQHPHAPRTFLSAGVRDWALARARRLAATGELGLADLLTGQLSVRTEVFAALGGFDEDFTAGGGFGGEDTDFGARLLAGPHRLRFAPDAVSHQYYAVEPAHYLRQWHQAGRADALFMRRHPGGGRRVLESHRPRARWNRFVLRPVVRVPVLSTAVAALARRAALAATRRRPGRAWPVRLFFRVRDLEYWRGVQHAGGAPEPRPARVLCYHALTDLAGAAVIADYGVPAAHLRRQLALLRRLGFHFVSFTELGRAVTAGGGLPRRPVLVTFDDCYRDLLDAGLPVLREQRVPALAFAVPDAATNSWDTAHGAPELALLDAAGLRALEAGGVEIGAHSRTHRPMTTLPDDGLVAESTGAADALAAAGLRAPRAFAYPFGDHDARVRQAVRRDYAAAFTVAPGLVRPAGPAADQLPRIEVLRRHGTGARFLATVLLAGRLPRLVGLAGRIHRAAQAAGRGRPATSGPEGAAPRRSGWRAASAPRRPRPAPARPAPR